MLSRSCVSIARANDMIGGGQEPKLTIHRTDASDGIKVGVILMTR